LNAPSCSRGTSTSSAAPRNRRHLLPAAARHPRDPPSPAPWPPGPWHVGHLHARHSGHARALVRSPPGPLGRLPALAPPSHLTHPVELLDRLLEPPQHEALLADRHPLPFDHEVSLSPLSVGLVPDSLPSWTSPFAALAPSTAPQRGLGELGIGRLRPMAHPSLRGADAVEATPHQSRDNPASVQRVSRATSPECRRGSAPEAWYRLVMPEPDGQTTDK
jgi:hypothetical protein